MMHVRLRTRVLQALRVYSGWQRLKERWVAGAAVLVYHGVVERLRDPLLDRYSIDVKTFESHLTFFRRYYDIVPLSRVIDHVRRGLPLPSHWLSITMDDGLQSQVQLGAQILQAHQCPWTLAVPAGLIGTGHSVWTYELRFLLLRCWHAATVTPPGPGAGELPMSTPAERRAAAAQLVDELLNRSSDAERTDYLDRLVNQFGRAELTERLATDRQFALADWSDLRRLQRDGVELASHGWWHRPQDATITREALRQECVTSRERMAAELGVAPQGFVLPFGVRGGGTDLALREAGYGYCLSTQPRRVANQVDLFSIPRFAGECPLGCLRAQLVFAG